MSSPAGDDGSRIVIRWSRNGGGRGGGRGGRGGMLHYLLLRALHNLSISSRSKRTPRQRELSSIHPLHSPEDKS